MEQKEQRMLQVGQLVWPLCLYYAVNNIVVIVGIAFWQNLRKDGPGVWESLQVYVEAGIKMLGMILGALAVYPYYKKEKMYAWQNNKMTEKKKGKIADGAGIIILALVTSLSLNYAFSSFGILAKSEEYQQVAKVQFALPVGMAMIFYGIIAPLAEELVFRGIVYRSLARHTNEMLAITGSALLFGGFHGNIVQMLYGIVMGMIMVLIYKKYSGLWAPVLFHSTANIAVYLCSYFL